MNNYLHFYLDCPTNQGILRGVSRRFVWTETAGGETEKHDLLAPEFDVKPLLRKLNALTEAESLELINKGFSIGRPKGYSFSAEAFLYLLTLRVDLFGMIDSGQALDQP